MDCLNMEYPGFKANIDGMPKYWFKANIDGLPKYVCLNPILMDCLNMPV